MSQILACLEDTRYTSVESLCIQSDKREADSVLQKVPGWINYTNCPKLEHLDLGGFRIPDSLPPIPYLKSLSLATERASTGMPVPSFSLHDALLSASNLSSLTLFGTTRSFGDLYLTANSISLPSLRELKIYPQDHDFPGLDRIIIAIDATDLDHLEFVPRWGFGILSHAPFWPLGVPKFPRLRKIRLKNTVNEHSNMALLASAFPMLRHAALGGLEVSAFIARSPRPIDRWEELESLTIIGPEYTFMEQLLGWLEERYQTGRGMLHVRLEGLASTSDFLEFHNKILQFAVVELDDIKLKIGKATFVVTPSIQAKLSKATPDIASALGNIRNSDLVPCEDDDDNPVGFDDF
ncbi:hypothetical protein HYDPIDRAFT_34436 [Hydnomerulius pinastri MD-312]|nr:hypothetical protein HYDPIDRAFT_34436 [Hydnomerulius pinastri MD-312]